MTPTFQYTVSFLEPGSHVYHVRLHMTNVPQGRHTLSLPVWTPGAYEVQDFARHIFDLRIEANHQTIILSHEAKNRWGFESFGDASSVTLDYKVYAFELGVDTSHLDPSHAYWNGAQLFMWLDTYQKEPYTVRVQAPTGWKVATGLDTDPEHPNQYLARNYDVLIDSPFECGTHQTLMFTVDNKPHSVVLWGHGNENADEFTQDIQRIVEAQRDIFGSLPYDHYTFIVHLSDRGTGGLEHLNSTTCGVSRFAFKPRKSYRRVLGLVSHEFFHLWNVKRIHPDMLGPFNYDQEVYTHLLWAMEGFTDYYAGITLRRSGLFSVKEYLKGLADNLQAYEKEPGRFVQSLAESSFDTWIKLYKPDEDSKNRTISYYLKGDLVGTCLDLEIRHRTQSQFSLDDVLRRLYIRYAAQGIGFPESVYQETVEEVAGSSFQEFFDRYIYGTEPIPIDTVLGYAGLTISRTYKDLDKEDDLDATPDGSPLPLPWLGIDTRVVEKKVEVSISYTTGPAANLLQGQDHVIAVDGYQIQTVDELNERLRRNYRIGDTVTISIFRRGQLMAIPIVLAEAPYNKVDVEPIKDPSQEQQAFFESWMKAPLIITEPN